MDKPCLSFDKSHSKLKNRQVFKARKGRGKKMHTNMWVVDNVVERKKYYPQLQEAAKLLRENEAVAFLRKQYMG